jgi:hypothetical protein
MDPGLKGCQYLLGKVPSWVHLTDREKMEWLNKLLSEMWPYYDRAICAVVKEVVEPLMEQYRPPGIIKRIFFQEVCGLRCVLCVCVGCVVVCVCCLWVSW